MTPIWRLNNKGGRPPLDRPEGASRKQLIVNVTADEWLEILNALPADTAERGQWILAAVRAESNRQAEVERINAYYLSQSESGY